MHCYPMITLLRDWLLTILIGNKPLPAIKVFTLRHSYYNNCPKVLTKRTFELEKFKVDKDSEEIEIYNEIWIKNIAMNYYMYF